MPSSTLAHADVFEAAARLAEARTPRRHDADAGVRLVGAAFDDVALVALVECWHTPAIRRHMRTFDGLSLTATSVSAVGVGAIARLLDVASLTWLRIEQQPLNVAAVHALPVASLGSLFLRRTCLDDEAARALAALIGAADVGRLHALDVSRNDFGDDGAAALLDVLLAHPGIRCIGGVAGCARVSHGMAERFNERMEHVA